MCRSQGLLGVGALLASFLCVPTGNCQPHERAPLTADQRTAVAGHNAFAIDLFHELRIADAGKNLLVSPFSISTALAMTYAGPGIARLHKWRTCSILTCPAIDCMPRWAP